MGHWHFCFYRSVTGCLMPFNKREKGWYFFIQVGCLIIIILLHFLVGLKKLRQEKESCDIYWFIDKKNIMVIYEKYESSCLQTIIQIIQATEYK